MDLGGFFVERLKMIMSSLAQAGADCNDLLTVSINKSVVDKTDDFVALTYNYQNYELTPEQLSKEIDSGYAQTYARMKDSCECNKCTNRKGVHRRDESFLESNVFALDFDNAKNIYDENGKKRIGPDGKAVVLRDDENYFSFADALIEPFIQENALILYHSPSSNPEWNRFRVVFQLPYTVKSGSEYQEIVSAFISHYGGDKSCKDLCRAFYGNKGGVSTILGKVLSVDALMSILKPFQEKQRIEIEKAEKQIENKKVYEFNTGFSFRQPGKLSPFDHFDQDGDVIALLCLHDWQVAYTVGETIYLTRPGKKSGVSASFNYIGPKYPANRFYSFTNSTQFKEGTPYTPYAVYAVLECGGDFNLAVKKLAELGFGDPIYNGDIDPFIDSILSSGNQIKIVDNDETIPEPEKIPDPVSPEKLRIPGFISEVMDYCLETAPYPNQTLAFCGALALQCLLSGRKVRDKNGNRTNLYILGLAHSGSGKDWPRKVNTKILFQTGKHNALGDRFASGEGIQDKLFMNPAMLFQTDEIDGMLLSMTSSKDARYESIMNTLLSMYSSANSIFPMRAKAGKEESNFIYNPHLVLFGTAIPKHYYESLSSRMLTNGFFARMLVFESQKRECGQDPEEIEIPARIIETANHWNNLLTNQGNLSGMHPIPSLIERTTDANKLLLESRKEIDAIYKSFEEKNDSVGTTVWARANEQISKLALVYACSENYLDPKITKDAVSWARDVIITQTERSLFMTGSHVAENPFDAQCQKVIRFVREEQGGFITHSALLRKVRIDAKAFQGLVDTLVLQDILSVVATKNEKNGKLAKSYILKS